MMREVRVTFEVIQDDVVIQNNGYRFTLPKDEYDLESVGLSVCNDFIDILQPHVAEVQLPEHKTD